MNLPNNYKRASLLTAGLLIAGVSAYGATWNGGGDGISWHDGANWDTGVVPASSAAENIIILGNSQVLFDSTTWSSLSSNGLLHSSTEYRGALRLLMGENTSSSTNGSHSLTFDHGSGNLVNFTTSSSQAVGSRVGKTSTLNIQSGTVNVGGNPFNVGGAGNGTINISGGSFIAGRSAPNIGTGTGSGAINITGGSFTTRAGANVGANGSFNVFGSVATEIGIGSDNSLDGVWDQAAGGILSAAIDAGGITKIFVDDVDSDGGMSATFAAGSILDLGFLSIPAIGGTWTLLELENADISDLGLQLAAGDAAAGWSFNVDNTGVNGLLTATYTVPEPSTFAFIAGSLSLMAVMIRRRRA